jgi:predicted phosphodiesterase
VHRGKPSIWLLPRAAVDPKRTLTPIRRTATIFPMTTRSAARLTWLHLSDFHFREKTAWSQDVVLKSLLEDVRARYAGANAPDLLFLTGDIAFSGKREEYLLAEAFVIELREGLKMPPERICVVPGNHDIDLDREEDAFAGARATLTNIEEVDRFFAKEGRRKTLFARQEEFRAFANRIAPPGGGTITASSYAHQRLIRVGALWVRALLLDSAWLSQGGPADAGSLILGERQIIDCAAHPSGPSYLTFALLHHPFPWLAEFEQLSIENLVIDHADICLRGHVHSPDMRAIDRSEARLATFTAGAAFTRRTADNTYVWCSLDLQTGSGEHVVHRYNHVDRRWDASEQRPWHLLTASPPVKDAASTRSELVAVGAQWPSFCTCLLTGLQSEVPLEFPGRKIVFVSFEAKIPEVENKAGSLVVKLRHHFYWREIWDATSWKRELQTLVSQFDSLLQVASRAGGIDLVDQETRSQSIFDSVTSVTSAGALPAIDEIRALVRDSNSRRAHLVIDRWRGSGLLSPGEAIELDRLEILAFLSEQKAGEALAQADRLLAKPERTSGDIALAARCALDSKNFARAAQLMHAALDGGVPVAEAKTVALKIAGAAGDHILTERVMK